jgi:hypothetical protein
MLEQEGREGFDCEQRKNDEEGRKGDTDNLDR